MDCPMRGARAVICCLLAGLALSGCMRATSPVVGIQPQNDLDSMAYGQPYGIAPASTAMAYAAAPAPAGFDAAYRLDAGDRLRVVVYGQEGLTNTYAIDAGGSITMPLIGAVPAPGQYPYVPNMSVESAVAIAGGFSPRALRDRVTLTHTDGSGSRRVVVPLGTAISPGDTVLVGERWF
jgi:polysaccharide export outer membrane protein